MYVVSCQIWIEVLEGNFEYLCCNLFVFGQFILYAILRVFLHLLVLLVEFWKYFVNNFFLYSLKMCRIKVALINT